MREVTEQDMVGSLGGESMASMRSLYFATRAEENDPPNAARPVPPIAHAGYIHAGDHYRELRHLEGGLVANRLAPRSGSQVPAL